jgi:signal transduction histidine kinase
VNRPRSLRLLFAAAVALGVMAEWRLSRWGAPRSWIPDLLTGWTFLGCGFVAWTRRPESRAGPLFTAAGAAWFLPNLAAGGWLGEHALYLHRAPLFQLVLTYPRGSPRGRAETAAIAVGWIAAASSPLWESPAATLAAVAVLAAFGWSSRSRVTAPTVALAGALAVPALVRLLAPTAGAQESTLLIYQASLCALATALLTGLLRSAAPAVADLVVELGAERSPLLRDAFARALGDPAFAIGFWVPESETYVDGSGRLFDLASTAVGKRVTRVESDGCEVAVLVHDRSAADDAVLLEAVATAARFAAANARLHAEVRSQIKEVAASRQRLVAVADQERSRLEARLREGAGEHLEAVANTLRRATQRPASPATAVRVERAQTQLVMAIEELHELAAGLHPRAVIEGGLEDALRRLAERSPAPVRMQVTASDLPEEVEVAAYFVCAEALANVAKYANASSVAITIAGDAARTEVRIEDDGAGGAHIGGGSGLSGLQDRVEALGGSFAVASPPGGGTIVRAVIPTLYRAAGRRRSEAMQAIA